MSFPRTIQHLKPTGPSKYVVPMRKGKGNAMEYYLTPELKEIFARMFPTHTNHEMMKLFGMSSSTLHRFARSMGLTKNMKVISHKQGMMVKRTCEANGYYDSIRGKRPSEATIEGARRYFKEHGHPLAILRKKNPRKYKRLMQKRSETRKEIIRKERWRERMGLALQYNLPYTLTADFKPYTKSQACHRCNVAKRGYILGDSNPKSGERYIIFFDATTQRSPRMEANLLNDGFKLVELVEDVVEEYRKCID